MLGIIYLWAILLGLVNTKKPHNKRQQEMWRVECDLGVINDSECPVDGGWTPWGPWSTCRGLCDEYGRRHRSRECTNPSPSKDGLPCYGVYEQSETCYINNCTIADYRKLVEGDLARLEAMRQLEAVPALMARCLQTECNFDAIETALSSDNTWQINPESLWNALHCVKRNVGCPVVGEWGTWGEWSACGARCGLGSRWRLRRCDTPPPSDSRFICSGSPLQVEQCEGDQCSIDVSPDEEPKAEWSPWGSWTSCTENCGSGIKRRRRICNETFYQRDSEVWGTHCLGQHDQLDVCNNKICILNGGWSGWGPWGPCSQSCGAGSRSRSRSCTRPIPSGGGTLCSGAKTETGPCHITPCEVHSHTVAVLNGESSIHYHFENRRSTLFHFFIRFLPLSPHGTLVRRGSAYNPTVRLSLQKWHICLDASGSSKSCSLSRICTPVAIEPAIWHTVLLTVTNEAASLKLDDSHVPIRGTFPCDPELQNENVNILIGEKLHGEIQEIILNFIPLKMVIEKDRWWRHLEYSPTSASNLAFEKAVTEEAFLVLDFDQYLRMPCFHNQNEWQIQLTIKPSRESGTVIFLKNKDNDAWFHLSLQNMRLKMQLGLGDLHSESISSTECIPEEWLDVILIKKKETNTIEASINSVERIHIVPVDETARKRRHSLKFRMKSLHKSFFSKDYEFYDDHFLQNLNNSNEKRPFAEMSSLQLCNDEFFVGGIPIDMKSNDVEELSSLFGTVAAIIIDGVLKDLHQYSVERYKDNAIQLSSRTASVSGSYHETAWGSSNNLNLTCLHARSAKSTHNAQWLFLDTTLGIILKRKKVRSIDDGRVLRLVATADNDLRGFYTCRAHTNRRTRNIVTYGILGKAQHKLSGPDTTTAIAVFTTISLVLATLIWLIIEGFHDLRNGYGFYRDCHWTPEQEAESICEFIDRNIHLYESKSLAEKAKARARRIGQRKSSKSSFAARDPNGMTEEEWLEDMSEEESSDSELGTLPALPEMNASGPSHEVFHCEQSYVSSPRHGSPISQPLTTLTSSSFKLTSPKDICSRLSYRYNQSSSTSYMSKRSNCSKRSRFAASYKNRMKLLTIKSSSFVNQSPVLKILQKFQQLKNDD